MKRQSQQVRCFEIMISVSVHVVILAMMGQVYIRKTAADRKNR
ncbi:hypothetical protein [Bacillus sonorensis]|nr:hypothetical protein [Bacillus sonorensis]TWK73882.1 hypothetical protein CHCC20335_2167 [Bacillus paralicheniformis]